MVLLRREGWQVSTSMVGRILKYLKKRGVLREPIWTSVSARKRQRQRPYAVRKPKEYIAQAPGDIVQVDTLDVRPLPGTVFRHFTARDVFSRWDVLEVHTRATSNLASRFLEAVIARMPFPVRAILGSPESHTGFLGCPQRWMGGRSSRMSLSRNVGGGGSSSLSCHHAPPS